MGKILTAFENDAGVAKYSFGRDDGHGRKSKYYAWNQPGNDITGMVARSEKVAGTFEQLLDGEVYHYHTKLTMKDPYTGGRFNWHQDYGYWYYNGCLFPDMGTVFIALDRTDKENGCLQVVPRSHKMGRIAHVTTGEEVGADLERVEQVLKVLPVVHVEMNPGDALFFHSNVLHQSDQNNSARRRWAYLIAYNRASNNPVTPHHHPQYTPLHKVPDSAILAASPVVEEAGKDYFLGDGTEYKALTTKVAG
ncbi:phytanoyl-CoA dioxygenase-like isoform X2 [Lingula anatina]|uniref:Phytanoyl-CoA dioxygenase-like isoform X2 n=2 Tax=Lingula anatina TaxID=7574 RepID=A0A1S3I9T6_LINAN|nr:phytanoyl-CoA dioxygenase-like isoform X2 [Lingula anatina]|eukprot:XP_013395022.1 phytanoyl-CoA dioxygenase-like isoform X2 [Lingula anatina]